MGGCARVESSRCLFPVVSATLWAIAAVPCSAEPAIGNTSSARNSPWLLLQPEHQRLHHHALLRIASSRPHHGEFRWDLAAGLAIFLAAMIFALCTVRDIHNFISLLTVPAHRVEPNEGDVNNISGANETPKSRCWSSESVVKEVPQWSVGSIILLTSYRFYTGFLSATWLPYLLAMEGQYLWQERQSLFMGLAKLIYGFTVLMNPVFGLMADQAVLRSHGVGRRLFVRCGIITAALGMYVCILAGRDHAFLSFLSGILLWRLGEALNDVTTEALVPEMVPSSQFQVASATKASSFLLGGLVGYAMLIVFAEAHYSWLYYAYPVGMFVCSLPALMLLDQDRPTVQMHQTPMEETFSQSLLKAYIGPTGYQGGFPRACLSVFVFSLGTTPMFFLLLIVRDLVGVTDRVVMQQQFSAASIVFFLCAAVSSVVCAISDPASGGPNGSASARQTSLEWRGKLLVSSMAVFGFIVLLWPCLTLFKDEQARNIAFYSLTVVFGAAFGAAYTLFQDITWQLLPPGIKVANAMGFNVMSRLLGVGLGNFAAGMILDLSLSYTGSRPGEQVYSPWAYVIMCTSSGLAVLTSSCIAYSVVGVSQREELVPLTPQSSPSRA